jgi:ribosomal protein S18 acetylase RimI-like enzyme
MVRLVPMTDEEFHRFVERRISVRAARWVARGLWAEDRALETARQGYAEQFPQGRETPHHRFCHLVDDAGETRVGEAWFWAVEEGGKVQFWINWLEVDPAHRRRGYATEALRLLEEEARRLGADRTLLVVWADNPGARALYERLGYVPSNTTMQKPLGPSS